MTRSALLVALVCLGTVLRADQVDTFINNQVQSGPIPGVCITVLKDGKELKIGAYGVANLELDAPTTRDTVFELGALSSQFTRAGILLLNEAGKLSLDDPISKYLSGTPTSWKDITIRHCLSGTSGLKSYTYLEGFELRYHLKQDEFIRKISQYPLEFEPGSKYSYTSTDSSLLGHIIVNVSGQNYSSFIEENIFKPLKMTSTCNRDPLQIIPNRASGYVRTKSGGFAHSDYDLTDMFAAADMATTVVDFAKWDDSLNGNKILSESSLRLLWTSSAPHSSGFVFRVGKVKGHTEYNQTGATGGFGSAHCRFPDDKLSVIVLANHNDGTAALNIARGVAEIYLREK